MIGYQENILTTIPNISGISKWNERYISGANFEANYLTRRDFNTERDTIGTNLVGINSTAENDITQLSKYVIEGDYLSERESGYVLIGSNMLGRFSSAFGDGFGSLDGVYPGDRVKVTVNGKTKDCQQLLNGNLRVMLLLKI